MADFGARFTDGAALVNWTDPALGERPSRIHSLPELPPKRRLATTGEAVQVSAVVAGVVGPLDAALSGRYFFGWFTEYAGPQAPTVSSPPGQSSVRSFTPDEPGHYTYVLRRMGGGGLLLHVDAIDFEGG